MGRAGAQDGRPGAAAGTAAPETAAPGTAAPGTAAPGTAMPGTVEAALREATGLLARAGIAEPRHEARLVIGHVLRVGPEVILGHPERAVAPAALRKIAALVAARARHQIGRAHG